MTNNREPLTGYLDPTNTCDIGRRVDVFLDGKELHKVTACHTVEGWADVVRLGDDGRIVVEGEDIVIDRLHGVVTVKEVGDGPDVRR